MGIKRHFLPHTYILKFIEDTNCDESPYISFTEQVRKAPSFNLVSKHKLHSAHNKRCNTDASKANQSLRSGNQTLYFLSAYLYNIYENIAHIKPRNKTHKLPFFFHFILP